MRKLLHEHKDNSNRIIFESTQEGIIHLKWEAHAFVSHLNQAYKKKFNEFLNSFKQMTDIEKNYYINQKDNLDSKYKIFLVNDTSQTSHTGCLTVMRSINKKISNFRITGRLYNENLVLDSHAKSAIEESGLILINGEGTMHHNTKKCNQLLDIIDFSISLKKK